MTDVMPSKPIEPGPTCTEAERHAYAQANAKWSAWLDQHPKDAEHASVEPAEPGQVATHD